MKLRSERRDEVYLKRLEIQGFKSLVDKVDLELVSGITAVIGPNGSGKSNLGEAVRWVLGEQSVKSLRSNRMEDIIFSGSHTRKPVGMAQVTLTLDNSDGKLPLEFNEVYITRRLYRSGESEYLINKVPCRLKDLQELFWDTGLGKEGFAIIGQGQVERVINCQPSERRLYLEEAAGIAKYRHRKKETEKKLEETWDNLARVEDLTSELTGQLGPLAQEAARAEEYQRLTAAKQELEISLLLGELETRRWKEKQTEEEFLQVQDQVVRASAALAQLEAGAQALKQTLFDQERELEQERLRQYQLENSLRDLQGDLEVKRAQKSYLAREAERIQREQEALQVEIDRAGGQAQELLGQGEGLKSELEAERSRLDGSDQKSAGLEEELGRLKQSLAREQQTLFAFYQEQTRVVNEKKAAQLRWEEEEKRLAKLKIQRTEAEEEETRLLNTRDTLERAILEIDQSRKELDQNRRGQENNLTQLAAAIFALQEEKSKIQQEYYQLRSNCQVLRRWQENYEGYASGPRSVLKARTVNQELKEIRGAVAELLEIPAEFRLAVDVALGSAQQYIVVDSDAGAQQAVAFLKRERLGRATFLPLNTVQARRNPQARAGLNSEGIIGLAGDLVKTDPAYQVIIDFLLGSVLVARDLRSARKAAKASNFRLKIVTLEGEVLNPGGSITGGSFKKTGNAGLLGQRQELQEQEAKLKNLEQDLKEHQQRIEQLVEKQQAIEQQRQQDLKHLQQLDLKRAARAQELAGIDNELKKTQRSLQLLVTELKLAAGEQQNLAGKQKELTGQEQELQQKIDHQQKLTARLSDESQKLEQDREAQKSLELERRLTMRDLEHRWQTILQKQRELREAKLKLEAQQDKYAADLRQKTEELHDLESQIENQKVQVQNLAGQLTGTQKSLEARQEERRTQQARAAALEEQVQEASREVSLLKGREHRLELELTRLVTEKESLVNKLEDQFSLNEAQARAQYQPLEQTSEINQSLKQIRDQLEELGAVNLGSIEHYQKLKERADFLTGQREDLVLAIKQLQEVIKGVEQTMVQQFRQAFSQINAAFEQIFSELFGGGKGELFLTDPENILESGVEIKAEPPGKKLKHLSLLSGGEKALTAIALLFAILQVNPSPFCILDEIEAALDEANVERFAAYLKKMAHNCQFVVVTHRQGTMECADCLYGVTMEEDGVSRVLSVKLRDVIEQAG